MRTAAPAVALGAVGAVFVWKYGAEVSPLAGAGAVAFLFGYVAAIVAAYVFASRLNPEPTRRIERLLGGGLLVAATVLAFGAPLANDVARLPALSIWLERFATGTFPYGLPVRPSGFPGLFALAAPLWVTRLLPLLPVVGLALFGWALARSPTPRLAPLLALTLLPPIWYEVVVHSELFFNAALALAALVAIDRLWRRGPRFLFAAAVLAGCVLSTRLFVGAAFAVYGTYAFRDDWGRGATFAVVALGTWTATWLPFWVWDAEAFAAFGPFVVQGLYLPMSAIGGAVLVALALGWTADDLDAVIARTGWVLLALVTLSGALTVDTAQPLARFARFDVGYLLIPTPFLLAALARPARRFSTDSTP